MYGINQIEEINRRIFLEMNSLFKNSFSKFIEVTTNIVAEATRLSKSKDSVVSAVSELWQDKQLKDHAKDLVFCFDDLERVELEIEVVLGYIHRYVEYYNIKTICIGNEKEIIENKYAKYFRIKEKLIGYTLSLEPSLPDVIDHFTQKYNGFYKKILEANKQLIIETVKASNVINLRIVKTTLNLGETIFPKLEDYKLSSNIIGEVFLFLLIVNLEYKSGKLQERINNTIQGRQKEKSGDNIDQDSKEDFEDDEQNVNARDILDTLVDKSNSAVGKREEIISDLDIQYGDLGFTSKAILIFSLDGYFDNTLFKEELSVLQRKDSFSRKTAQIGYRFLNTKTQEFLSDEEFEKASKEYIEKLKNHNIHDLFFISRLNFQLFRASYHKLINENPEIIKKLLLKTINCQHENRSLINKFRRVWFSCPNEDIPSDSAHYKYRKEVDEKILQVKQDLLRRERVQEAKEFIGLFDREPKKFFEKFYHHNENDFYNRKGVFEFMNPQDLFNLVKELDNPQKVQFRKALHDRYEQSNKQLRKLKNESLFIDKLKPLLKEYIEQQERKLSSHLLRLIYQELELSCEKIKQSIEKK